MEHYLTPGYALAGIPLRLAAPSVRPAAPFMCLAAHFILSPPSLARCFNSTQPALAGLLFNALDASSLRHPVLPPSLQASASQPTGRAASKIALAGTCWAKRAPSSRGTSRARIDQHRPPACWETTLWVTTHQRHCEQCFAPLVRTCPPKPSLVGPSSVESSVIQHCTADSPTCCR